MNLKVFSSKFATWPHTHTHTHTHTPPTIRHKRVRGTTSLLYNNDAKYWVWTREIERHRKKAMEEEEEIEGHEEEPQQVDDEQYVSVPKIKWVYEGTRVKGFSVNGNLNGVNTRMIMTNLISHWDLDKGNLFIQIGNQLRYWWNGGSQQDVNFTTRYVYQFRRDSSIYRRMWAKEGK